MGLFGAALFGAELFWRWPLSAVCLITHLHTSLPLEMGVFHLTRLFFKKATGIPEIKAATIWYFRGGGQSDGKLML